MGQWRGTRLATSDLRSRILAVATDRLLPPRELPLKRQEPLVREEQRWSRRHRVRRGDVENA